MSTFESEGFVLLPPMAIQRHLDLARRTAVSTALKTRLTHLLSTDCYFAHSNSDEPVKEFDSIVESWVSWVRDSTFYEFALGFHMCCSVYDIELEQREQKEKADHSLIEPLQAIMPADEIDIKEPDEDEKKQAKKRKKESYRDIDHDNLYIPFVIDPTLVDIYVRQTATSDMEWRVCHRQRDRAATTLMPRLIEYCRVFCVKPPVWSVNFDGNINISINSTITRLIPEFTLIEQNRIEHIESIQRMCNPQLITQQIPDRIDPNDPKTVSMHANHNVDDGEQFIEGHGIQVCEPATKYDGTIVQPVAGLTNEHYIKLGKNEQLATMTSVAPVPYYNETIERFHRECWSAMGVPMGIQLNLDPHQKQEPGVGKSTGGSQSSQGHSTAYHIWIDNQRELRLTKSNQAKVMMADFPSLHYRNIYGIDIPKRLSNNPIELRIPGIPQYEDVSKLYKEGVLKYSSFIRHAGRECNLNKNDFEAFPKLSLKEVNGIPPPKPAETKKPKKKKK
jgi:hypothetical protein